VDLSRILAEPVDWRYKCFPPSDTPVTVGTIGSQQWNALTGDLIFPVMLVRAGALHHNIDLMANYCRDHGVDIAPHGKTPMAPQIVSMQLDAGAWAVSAATIHQARVFRAFGAQRIVLANELIGRPAIEWAFSEVACDEGFELFCLVDSEAQVQAIADVIGLVRPTHPIYVLIEMGCEGGRTGCRTLSDARRVGEAVNRHPALRLVGVEGYEGPVQGDGLAERLSAVDQFMGLVREATVELDRAGLFEQASEIVVSAGGSTFFDRAVRALAGGWTLSRPVRPVIRAGAYVGHDVGNYEQLSPLAARSDGGPRLQQVLEIWGSVLSRPQADLAVLDFGRRDVSYDQRLPMPFEVRISSGKVCSDGNGLTLSALYDQHAILNVPVDTRLAVGDIVGCHLLHPCTAFDKWRLIPVVDDDYTVTSALLTYF